MPNDNNPPIPMTPLKVDGKPIAMPGFWANDQNQTNNQPVTSDSPAVPRENANRDTGSTSGHSDHPRNNAGSQISHNPKPNEDRDHLDLTGQRINFQGVSGYILQRVRCGKDELYAIETDKFLTGCTGRCPRCDKCHANFQSPYRSYYASVEEIHKKFYGDQENNERAKGAKPVDELKTGSAKALPLSEPALGRNKGIEGDANSCYMDSTIFCMFAYSGVFDSLLNKRVNGEEIIELQTLLRENIINLLRTKPYLVERDALYHLRVQLSKATGDKSFREEEKDPSEFLRAFENLFDYAPLKTIPPDQRPRPDQSNITANIMWEMFDANLNKQRSTNIGSIFRNSLIEIPAKLATVPPFLILVAPRHSRTERSYRYIIPDRKITLDHQMVQLVCQKCKKTNHDPNDANNFYYCYDCSPENSPPSTETRVHSYCFGCIDELHDKSKRNSHKLRQVKDMITLNLFAVLCIERCHYVAFVKCQKSDNTHEWLFFDSMSDRVADSKNVPAVSGVSDFEEWIVKAEKNDALFDDIDSRRNSGRPLAKEFVGDEMKKLRLFRDGAFFFYENPAANYH